MENTIDEAGTSWARSEQTLRKLQERDVVTRERQQAIYEEDVAGYPKRQRATNHHDMFARVVMTLLEGHAHDWSESMVESAVRCGRMAADIAYPPLQP